MSVCLMSTTITYNSMISTFNRKNAEVQRERYQNINFGTELNIINIQTKI